MAEHEALAPTGAPARSWVELLDQLYEGSWNEGLRRFRSPFAFRGLVDSAHTLDNSLVRLSAGHPDIATLERSMLRNFRKYAVQQASSGVDSNPPSGGALFTDAVAVGVGAGVAARPS